MPQPTNGPRSLRTDFNQLQRSVRETQTALDKLEERWRIADIVRSHLAKYPQGSAAGLALRALLAEIEAGEGNRHKATGSGGDSRCECAGNPAAVRDAASLTTVCMKCGNTLPPREAKA